MEAERITLSKENILPLRQGRVAKQLSEALQAQESDSCATQQFLQQKRREFETLLHTYEGPDPLTPWCDYLAWVEQYYPKQDKEGNYVTLLRKCLGNFKDSEQYKQDLRYVNLWIKYLELYPNILSEMYNMLLHHGIGTQVTAFYHNWATAMAHTGDLKRANEIYGMGKEAGAQPAEELELAHKNLQFRFMRHVMEPQEDGDGDARPAEGRVALSSLEPSGPLNMVPVDRSKPLQLLQPSGRQSQQPLMPRTSTQTHFSVAPNENPDGMSRLPQQLKAFPDHEMMRRENVVPPKRWTECGTSNHTPSIPQPSTPFKVLDEAPQLASSVQKHVVNSVLRERRKAQETCDIPLALFEPEDPNVKRMYCKSEVSSGVSSSRLEGEPRGVQVYAGGTEFSLEELRALRYQKYAKEGRKPPTFRPAVPLDVPKPQEVLKPASEQRVLPGLLLPNQRFMFAKVYIEEPEVSFEENYARLHKARMDQKKAKEEAEALTKAQAKEQEEKEKMQAQTYEIPEGYQLCVPEATLEAGVERSLEELRAARCIQSARRAKLDTLALLEVKPRAFLQPAKGPEAAAAAAGPSLAPTTPQRPPTVVLPALEPNQRLMFDVDKVYTSTTEFSFEELRAMHFIASQLYGPSVSSTPNSSRGTTPSGTPYGSILGQSMTVNTREVMAAVRGMWCSRTESFPDQSSMGTPVQSPFPVYTDPPQPTPQFTVFCDASMAQQPRPDSHVGSKRTLQMVDVKNEIKVERMETEVPALGTIKLEVKHEVFSPAPQPVAAPFTVLQDRIGSHDAQPLAQPLQQNSALSAGGFRIFQEQPERRVSLVSEQAQPFNSWAREVQDDTSPCAPRTKLSKRSIFLKVEESEEVLVWEPFPAKYSIPLVPVPPDAVDVEEVPDKENANPSGKPEVCEPRELAGVLVEATNVPFIPLEQQERMRREEDAAEQMEQARAEGADEVTELLVVQPPAGNTRYLEDVTCLTTVFRPTNFVSSTPHHSGGESLLSRIIGVQQPPFPLQSQEPSSHAVCTPVATASAVEKKEQEEEPQPSADNGVVDCTTAPRLGQPLSPILEMTGESRSSRSGSSSGSSASSSCISSKLHAMTACSSYGFSKTPGQFSKTPGQFSKTPGQFKTPNGDVEYSQAVSTERPRPLGVLRLDEEEEEENEPQPETQVPPQIPQQATSAPQELQREEVLEKSLASLSLCEKVDPFSTPLRRHLLSSLDLPLDQRPGFRQYSQPLPTLRISQGLYVGYEMARVKRVLGEGAYAKVFLARMGPEERPAVLKVAAEDATCWDFYISSELQRRLQPQQSKFFNQIKSTHLYSNGVIYEMDFVSRATIMGVVNYYKQQLPVQEMPLQLALLLSSQVLETVSALRRAQIIHADLKPDNFLLVPSDDFGARLQLIDYGRSIDMSLLPAGTSFSEVFAKPDFRCVEMRTGQRWTYQLDLFAAAATIHCLIFGKYMNMMESKGKWKPTCKPKRFWPLASEIEQLFESLLNVESCEQQLDLQPYIEAMRRAVADNSGVVLTITKELRTIMKEISL